jgi:hypothetical protein
MAQYWPTGTPFSSRRNVLKNWQVYGIWPGEGWAISYAKVASQAASQREASNGIPVKTLFPI